MVLFFCCTSGVRKVQFQNGFEKIEGYVTTDCPRFSNSYVLFLEGGGFFEANLEQFRKKQAGPDLCLNALSQVAALEKPTSEEHGDISSMTVCDIVSCVLTQAVTPGKKERNVKNWPAQPTCQHSGPRSVYLTLGAVKPWGLVRRLVLKSWLMKKLF